MIDVDFTARFIAGFEGFVDHVYCDAAGVETIGYGETGADVIARYRGCTITQAEALALLRSRVQGFADAVEACVTNRAALTPDRHAALTSFAYNVGVGALRESTALQRFNNGDLDGVPEALSWWDKAGGRVLPGLARRRAAEAALFRGGGAPAAAPPAGPGAPPWPGRLLHRGDAGDDVRTMQRRLADRGWALAADGQFGPRTDSVVERFQREKGLAVDRLVGPKTWAALWDAPVT